MAVQPMDAAQCFAFLSDNLPSWITRVSTLTEHTIARNAEFAEEYKKLADPLKQSRKRNSSAHSLRPRSREPNDDISTTGSIVAIQETPDNEDKCGLPPAKAKINPLKRSNDELSSSKSVVLPPSARVRHNLVIHFDGHTQQELEQVVRDIGIARNCIRKGKVSHLSRRPVLSSGRQTPLTRRGAVPPPLPPVGGIREFGQTNPFDSVDKQLELAQSLCETAAHQFLRCGSCAAELRNVQEKFKSVLEVAIPSAARFKQEKEAEEKKEVEEDIRKKTDSRGEPVHVMPLVKPGSLVESIKGSGPPTTALEIEVDDSASDESIAIDITAFRSTRIRV